MKDSRGPLNKVNSEVNRYFIISHLIVILLSSSSPSVSTSLNRQELPKKALRVCLFSSAKVSEQEFQESISCGVSIQRNGKRHIFVGVMTTGRSSPPQIILFPIKSVLNKRNFLHDKSVARYMFFWRIPLLITIP